MKALLAGVLFFVSLAHLQSTHTITLNLTSTARCDTDVRITQDGRAVVSRAIVTQLGFKKLSVEVEDNVGLRVFVQGRQCHINYSVDVPIGRSDKLYLEIGDTPQMLVAR